MVLRIHGYDVPADVARPAGGGQVLIWISGAPVDALDVIQMEMELVKANSTEMALLDEGRFCIPRVCGAVYTEVQKKRLRPRDRC